MQKLNISAILCGLLLSALSAQVQAQPACWVQRIAGAGAPKGTGRLAAIYKEGEAKALAFLQRAADVGHTFSMLVIGSSYGYAHMGQLIDRKEDFTWDRNGIAAGEECSGKAPLKPFNMGLFE